MQRPARRGHREDGRRLRGELGKSKGGELCVVSGGGRREAGTSRDTAKDGSI